MTSRQPSKNLVNKQLYRRLSKQFKNKLTIFILSIISVLLYACGNSSTAQQSAPTNSPAANRSSQVTQIKVIAKEMEFKLSSNTAPAGPIEFVVTNQGKLPHEMEIIKTDLPIDKLPVEGNQLDTDKAGKEIAEIEEDDLESGTTETLRVNLTPGNYVLVCNLPGHFQSGMKAPLTVK